MHQETTQTKSKKIASATLVLLFSVMLSCVAPEAVKMEIQGMRNDMGKLEKMVDQKADNTVVAKQVDQINNKIEQTTQIAEELSMWKKNVQAETINYSGAGWVVIGTGVMALIFVGSGLLLVRAFMKRGNMLTLITRAVKTAGREDPGVARHLKRHLKKCVDEGYACEKDRDSLGSFARKVGHFVEQK